jgi:putative membrane-bound dehydrogenase-like protein
MKISAWIVSSMAALTAGVLVADDAALPRVPATEPAAAEKTFKVQDGFRMELIASEPLVTDPVAITYDENGLAYVVEMNDYPYTDAATHQAWKENTTDKAIGKVRVLEDTDGDGKYDKSYIFADNLSWPTGIAFWKGGVFVTATPDIWYFKDTNGDHKADEKRKVFTGFRKYNVQAVINNPIWGLDHKLYVAGSGNGGDVMPGEKTGEKPIKLNRNDFAIDPITEKFELIPGGARFGNTFDEWGNRFICNIRNPAQHVVFDTRYLARNPYFALPTAIYDSAPAGDNLPVYRISALEPWRELRAKQWTEQNHKVPRSELIAGGVFTSASGLTVYRGGAYPEKYRGQAFLGEVANNVVYRQTLTPSGTTFKAEHADAKVEFVASTDTWFRPVNFANAPDGTLHILDMYREVIEHPWSIPDDIHAKLDLQSGRDRGRIYRLAPPGFKVPKAPQLGKATTGELVAALAGSSAWTRETAHRLIFERQDKAAAEPLRNLLATSKDPVTRLHALWSLQGLATLDEKDLLLALADSSAGIRENAIRIAEPLIAKSTALFDAVRDRSGDADLRVRYQVALSLGGFETRKTASALAEIAMKNPDDDWIRAAVCSATPTVCAYMSPILWSKEKFATTPGGLKYVRNISFILGAENKLNNLYELWSAYSLVFYCTCYIQEDFVGGLGDGLRQAGKNLRSAFPNTNSIGAQKVDFLLSTVQHMSLAKHESGSRRAESIRYLAYDEFTNSQPVFEKLLAPAEPQEVHLAVLKALAAFKEPEATKMLFDEWPRSTPAAREQILAALLSRKDRLKMLFDAMEEGKISTGQINAQRQAQLLAHTDPAIKARAAKLFGQGTSTTRKEVVEKYKSALSLKGSAEHGQKVFDSVCVACHRFGGKGNEVGPNLETIKQWEPEKIMVNILDPNREVTAAFVSYDIELKDGTTVTGLITAEMASSVTMKRPDNTEQVILRQNIEKISSGGLSLMPEGLENGLEPQAMADLLAYLKN